MPLSVPVDGQDSVKASTSMVVRAASFPAFVCFLCLALVLSGFWLAGLQLNYDADDFLKLHEIRTLLANGDIFDRTLPGIVQPEPYVTHWPWIVDLPYAAMTLLLSPLLARESALGVACFLVPLLLLAPALGLYRRIIDALGFTGPLALPVACLFAMRAFFEFAPWRIDYHSLQIVLLLASMTLVLSAGRGAAFVNGLLTALAQAVSVEFAPFYLVIFAIYVFEWASGGDRRRLATFGGALMLGALAMFVAIVPPSRYARPVCDSYSLPHMLGLAVAGLAFAAMPLLLGKGIGRSVRLLAILAAGVLAGAALIHVFPQCRGGPYALIDPYVRQNTIDIFPQEMSLWRRPDIVLSAGMPGVALLFIGALAPAMLCFFRGTRDRAMLIFATLSVLSVVLGVCYFRYMRYIALFSGIGMLPVLAVLLPEASRLGTALGRRITAIPAAALIAPGTFLPIVLVLVETIIPARALSMPGAELADICGLDNTHDAYQWPAGTVLLAPPVLASRLLARTPDIRVVAITNHPAALGQGRVYRFFDPATTDPRVMLDQSRANHVVVCDWREAPSPIADKAYPLASSLMTGRAPSWLSACPFDAASGLRVYSYPASAAGAAACPGDLAGR